MPGRLRSMLAEGGIRVVRDACTLTYEALPGLGLYVVTGTCGERLELGVSVILRAEALPEGACEAFRRQALALFGEGGRERAQREPPEETFEGYREDGRFGLGPRPGATVDPQMAALFGRRAGRER